MLESIKASVRDTIIYGIGNVAIKLVGLFLIPVYTDPKYFTIEDFGVIGLLEVSGLVLTALLASSLPQSLTRFFWDKSRDVNKKSLFFMVLVTQIVVSLVLCAALIPYSDFFSGLIFDKTDWGKVITLLIISSGLQAINNIINTLMRLQSRAILFITSNSAKLLIVLLITIFLIIFRGKGLEGIYMAQVAGNLVFILILAGYSLKNIKPSFDFKLVREINAYGFPLLLASVATVTWNVIDRFALNSLSVLKYVAIYTLAYKVASVVKMTIVDSLRLAVVPIMFRKTDTPEGRRYPAKILTYTSLAIMAGIILQSLFSFEILNLISRNTAFRSAVNLVPLLSVSFFFVNLKDISVYGLHIVKKTSIIGIITVVTTVIAIFLNLLLIPYWDAYGSAVATLLAQIISWGATWWFSQKSYYIKYESRKLIILFVIGSLLAFSSILFNDLNLVLRLIIKISLFASFPFILFLFNFYDDNEIEIMRGFFHKWKNLRRLPQNIRSLKNLGDSM